MSEPRPVSARMTAGGAAYTPPPLPEGDYGWLVTPAEGGGPPRGILGKIRQSYLAGISLTHVTEVVCGQLEPPGFYVGGAGIVRLDMLTRDEAQRRADRL